jgi:hypothetical protein
MESRRSPIEVALIAEDENMAVLYCGYSDPWTWNDFYAALAQDEAISQSFNGRTLYRVVDLSETQFIPPGAVKHFRKASRYLMNAELTVYVTTNSVVRSVGKLMGSMFPRTAPRVRHVATLAEAGELISRLTADEFN